MKVFFFIMVEFMGFANGDGALSHEDFLSVDDKKAFG